VVLPAAGNFSSPGSFRADVFAGPAGNPAFLAAQQRFAVTPAAAATFVVEVPHRKIFTPPLTSAAQGSLTSCLNFDFAILNLFEPSAP
jgi:hypothetical protein